ncbi:hypothetical protein GCM10009525_12890 [Streptosporangium amethystogenes subsp. fukuiense]|uniref:hypothetical protein n=1 Tax=Streptosporangium amethystogenes TaxID=2002 RepID=UPI0031E32666
MIRTPDTDPASPQVSDIRCFFGQDYRDPDMGGSYSGIGEDANLAERKARQRVRLTLLRG